jgi:hypothetical protein
MLKDHERFIPFIAKLFKGERKVFIVDLLKDEYKILKYHLNLLINQQ